MEYPDFLVIGGGVIGILLSIEAKRRYPGSTVVILEKEPKCGYHASGRNSGVLHAGFYYEKESLKAKFAIAGNRELKSYCNDRDLPVNHCGKLIVAQNDQQLAGLEELLSRSKINGVPLEPVSEEEAKRIEPRVRTHERALFSPTTATVDPSLVMESLVRDAESKGVKIRTNNRYLKYKRGVVYSDRGRIAPGYVVNASGLYADKIAHDFGFASHYRILPFKGLYINSTRTNNNWKTNIYPVPDLAMPFLGVHLTVTVDGTAKIGPTAMPAFWREQYKGFFRFNFWELCSILGREALLFVKNEMGFRDLAFQELRKYRRATLVRLASRLAEGISISDFRYWGRPGIRAQLLDRRNGKLVMDFVYQGDNKSFHVLNVISPGFTCAFPFVRYLFDRIEELHD